MLKKLKKSVGRINARRRFIKHNKSVISRGNRRSGTRVPEILFESNGMCSWHIPNSLLGPILAEKYGGQLVGYRPLYNGISIKNIFSKYVWLFPINEVSVYRSFGVCGVVEPRCTRTQKQRAEEIANNLRKTLCCKEDVVRLRVNNIWVGDLIYDSYLKDYGVPTLTISDDRFWEYIRFAIRLFVFWYDYFSKHAVKAVCGHTCAYIGAIPLRIAISRGITGYQFNATHAYMLSATEIYAYKDFVYFREEFRRLSPETQKTGIEQAKRKIERRFSGEVGVDMNSTKSAYGENREKRLIAESDKVKVLIAAHCFFDSPHGYGENLFADFFEWLTFLGEMTLETDYDWYIKTHPDFRMSTVAVIQDIVASYEKFNLLPADSSHHQLIEEGIDVALTTFGTIGFEYAALGIPVINASSNNPHVAYNFNIHPKDQYEYKSVIGNLGKLSLEIDKEEVYEYYFMQKIYNTNAWIFENYEQLIRELGGYANQFKPEVYDKWIKIWDEERHAEISTAIENFIESGDYRLGGSHTQNS